MLLISGSGSAQAAASLPGPDHLHLAVPSGEQLDYLRYPAKGKRLLIWVSSERGQAETERSAARELAKRGIEVWLLDLNFSYFLNGDRKGFDQIPAIDLQTLLQDASKKKGVVAFAMGRAAVPILKAFGSWKAGEGRLGHLDFVLMHPNLYEDAEALQEPRYIDFGNLKGARLLILQPRRSAGVVWLDHQRDALQAQGAVVRNEILERLREGFWERQETTDYETEMGQHLADLVWDRLPKGREK
ncbi:MAG: hypothetical protein WBX11_01280 [Thiobacillaceae bacterium]